MDLNMMKQAMQLKSNLEKAQKELEKMKVEAESGNGAVKVTANGKQKILSIKIAPEAVEAGKAADLEKLVFKAVTGALDKSKELADEKLKKLTGGMKIPGLTD
ncbi:MAG TPA: nucleoid-associated protein, YbaB/EbfC family [Dehalococcoidia bacterium]|nr:nucleoid-associated protein, YbaB/EbfC family [Dehalococcoidia bacterium]